MRALLLPLLFGVPAAAQDADPRIAKATALIEQHMADKNVPGLSVAIAFDNALVWRQGFGLADIENEVPATPDTVYRFASISKALTATAAMKLVEQGKLDLDKPVREYVERWPEKEWPITTRQLLGHLGSIRHYRPFEIWSTKSYSRLQQGLGIFANDPLPAEPGTKFIYSTYGYTLAGCAMEAAADKPFTPMMKELIFDPAGMTSTRDDSNAALIPHRAQGYRRATKTELANSRPADTSYKIPGGGLCGTAPDLANFAIALMDGRLLQEQSRHEMWTGNKTNKGKQTDYGLGWRLGNYNGLQEVTHGGGQQRVSTYLYLCPERGLAIALLSNLEGASPKNLAYKIARLYLGD